MVLLAERALLGCHGLRHNHQFEALVEYLKASLIARDKVNRRLGGEEAIRGLGRALELETVITFIETEPLSEEEGK
jgi:hypothetical protein